MRSDVLISRSVADVHSTASRAYMAFKTVAEWLAAAALILFTFPILLATALAVKLASPGPIFYSQVRLGHNGKHFRIWKFRTMFHNCEAVTGPIWSTGNDNRVTRVGRILRDTHLDEMPQLWNILRGEMSLIGPRPERPEIAERIEAVIPGFHRRLAVKPGLTGFAQLSLPADSDMANVPYKLAHDLFYVEHQGLLLDVRIVISTFFHFAGAAANSLAHLMLKPIHSRRKLWEITNVRITPVAAVAQRASAQAEEMTVAA